jgi:hypothetical protein
MFRNPTNPVRLLLVFILLMISGGLLMLSSCAANRAIQSNANTQPAATPRQTETATPMTETSKTQVEPGALKVGETSGSYTSKGETVTLKYAYAGRAQRFGEESIIILLTDKEIPAEALAEEIKNQTMLLDGKIRGLEYAIMKDGYWVRYHPSQYQESEIPRLKDYPVESAP